MGERLPATLTQIPPLDTKAMEKVRERQKNLVKPEGSLGRLEELSILVAGIQGTEWPRAEAKSIVVMAGDHGVVKEGVSAFPPEVTAQMVANFLGGKAAINVLSRLVWSRLRVVDMGVASDVASQSQSVPKKIGYGTRNLATEPAMSQEEAEACIAAGVVVAEQEVAQGLDLLAIGDMGIGNTTPSSALVAAITHRPVAEVTGRGTGLDGLSFARKVGVIENALALHRPDPSDPTDLLSKVGGFEIGGLAGLILRAASCRVPIIIDGFITASAALIATLLHPRVKEYLIASHLSAEPGHRIALEWLGLHPLFDLQMRLGEGTGAALGLWLVEASVRLLKEMATFAEAMVSGKLEEQ